MIVSMGVRAVSVLVELDGDYGLVVLVHFEAACVIDLDSGCVAALLLLSRRDKS